MCIIKMICYFMDCLFGIAKRMLCVDFYVDIRLNFRYNISHYYSKLDKDIYKNNAKYIYIIIYYCYKIVDILSIINVYLL